MILGIDIGATKTLIALFSHRGHLLRRRRFLTAQNSDIFLRNLNQNLVFFQKYQISLIVVAVPGLVQKNYRVKFGNRNWPALDLSAPLKNLFNLENSQIFLENDASLGALFESQKFSGKSIYLTFSTGIGGGIVENGKILPESSSFEPGHKIYSFSSASNAPTLVSSKPFSSVSAEWEDLASASAIAKFYHVDRVTSLRKPEIMQDIAARVNLGLSDIIETYHPDRLILGGPVGKLLPRFSKYLPSYGIPFLPARRPFESTIYGCFTYAKQKLV